MKKALLAVMVVVLVLGFAGCDIWPFGAKTPYLPLKEGNTWEYSGTSKVTEDYPEGGPADTTYYVPYESKMEVVGTEETNWDEPIEVWELKSTVDTFVSYTYVDYDKDYIYYYMDLDETEEAYKIPSKPVLDDEWSITEETVIIDSIVDTDTFTTTYTFKTDYKVVADDETANDYEKCLKIEVTPENVGDYDSYECFDYWAKDVGSVMTTVKWAATYPYMEETYTMSVEGETKLDKFTEGE